MKENLKKREKLKEIYKKKSKQGRNIIQNDKKIEMKMNINESLNSLKNFIDKKKKKIKKMF